MCGVSGSDKFGPEPRSRDGLQARCKECNRARCRVFSAKYRASLIATDQQAYRAMRHEEHARHYAKHREKLIARTRAYEIANPEKIREYRRTSGVNKRSKLKHADRVADYDRQYHIANRETLNAKTRERYAKDPSTANARINRRRAREMNAPGDGVTAEQWREILEINDNRCAYCLERAQILEMDHVRPLSRGGEHSLDNVVPACSTCNSSKKAKLLLEIVSTPRLLVAQRMAS